MKRRRIKGAVRKKMKKTESNVRENEIPKKEEVGLKWKKERRQTKTRDTKKRKHG